MQVAKDAILPPNRPMQPVSGLELGLTAVCITLSLVLLVLSGSSLVQLQRRAMTAPTLVAELTH